VYWSRIGSAGALLACLTLLSGCVQDMYNYAKIKPLERSAVFADDRSSRQLVPDTVSRASDVAATPFNTGIANGKLTDTFPIPITRAVLDRGQERFTIYCSPCHGSTGYGDGMIVQRGFPAPPSYHIARLVKAPVGHFFDVMTHGYGLMYSYADRVSPADRWAIAAYIRVLQRSQDSTLGDVPPQERARLERTGK
jgi:mono/diheme cytochrome c family protein